MPTWPIVPTFKAVAKEIARDIEGCDLAVTIRTGLMFFVGRRITSRRYVDIDLIKRKFVNVQVIFHKMEARTLSAAYKFYCEKDLEGAHGAEADTLATYEVLMAQLDRYPELKNDIEFLSKFTTQNNNVDFAGRLIYNDKGRKETLILANTKVRK